MRKIAIVYSGAGDPPVPDKIETFTQAQEIAACIAELGMRATLHEFCWPPDRLSAELRRDPPDAVFNLVEDIGGREDIQYKAVEWMIAEGFPYTGNSPEGLKIGFDKIAIKKALTAAGIVSPGYYHPAGSSPGLLETGRYIVKSLDTHGSVGISAANVVDNLSAAKEMIAASRAQHGGEWFAEAFVEGRELTVSVIDRQDGPAALPPVEALFVDPDPAHPRIICYKAKWDEDSSEFEYVEEEFLDREKEPVLAARLEEQALRIWKALRLQGYARFDFRVNDSGLWLIDATPRPSLAHEAFVCNAAKQAGLSQADVVRALVDSAFRHSPAIPARAAARA